MTLSASSAGTRPTTAPDRPGGAHPAPRRPVLRLAGSVAALGAVAALVAAPFTLGSYWLRVVTMILMLAILAQSWSLVTGYVGYPAFGNVAFFGVGAYVSGNVLVRHDWPFPLAVLAAAIVAAAVCLALGPILMRVKGHYFAIATIGVMLAFRELALLVPIFSTGSAGTLILPSFGGARVSHGLVAYLWMAGLLVAVVAVVVYVDRSRYGYALRTISSDERAAATFGITTLWHKVSAWCISAFFTGAAGAVWASWIGVVEPAGAFDLRLATLYCVIALLGGLGTVPGPLLAAVLIGGLGEVVWAQYSRYHLLVLGLLIMVGTLLLPNGLMSVLRGEASLRERIATVREGRL